MQMQAVQTEVSSISSGVEILTLQAEDIEVSWEWIRTFLRRVKRHDWSEEDVKSELLEGKAQLWGAIGGTGGLRVTGIWITKIQQSKTLKWGVVWIAAGDGIENGLRLYEKYTEPWFRLLGCQFVEIIGRAGWKKVMKGFDERARVFVKVLE